MGVSGFFKFVENDPSLRPRRVDMAREARTAKASGREPVLVVDLPNMVRVVWGEELDWFCGGQHREFRRRMAAFVAKLRAAGIEPVFVTDGATPEAKLENWVGRQQEKWNYVQVRARLDCLTKPSDISHLTKFS